jgi:ATP-dependent Zn protease
VAHRRVRETLTGRRSALEALAMLLIEKEVIDAEQLRALLGTSPPAPVGGR